MKAETDTLGIALLVIGREACGPFNVLHLEKIQLQFPT